jgi:hypothetical protein
MNRTTLRIVTAAVAIAGSAALFAGCHGERYRADENTSRPGPLVPSDVDPGNRKLDDNQRIRGGTDLQQDRTGIGGTGAPGSR